MVANAFTMANICCGALGIIQLLREDEGYQFAIYWILLAAVFDFLDGFAARLLNAPSEKGKQLDSLADMVTFGLLPTLILFRLIELVTTDQNTLSSVLPYFSFLVLIASAYRLAKFNISTQQQLHFLGLPTPASALFVGSLACYFDHEIMLNWAVGFAPYIQLTILIITTLLALLLISNIPLIALKFKSFRFNENKSTYVFIAIAVCLFAFLHLKAFLPIIILYLAWSFLFKPTTK